MGKTYPRFLMRWIKQFIDPVYLIDGIRYLPIYIRNYLRYEKMYNIRISVKDSYPQLHDSGNKSTYDPHYYYSTAWVFRRIIENCPKMHLDIGSVLMLSSLLSAVCPVCFFDIRPLFTKLNNLYPVGGDILSLPFANKSVSSLSCVHVLEHIGLGRYGDNLDDKGTFNALKEIDRIMMPSGKLYLALPIGKEKLCFDAHRIFKTSTIIKACSSFDLIEFSGITDDGDFKQNISLNYFDQSEYACGLFLFEKK